MKLANNFSYVHCAIPLLPWHCYKKHKNYPLDILNFIDISIQDSMYEAGIVPRPFLSFSSAARSCAAMESDPHNVHQFWGVSPAIDLVELCQAAAKCQGDGAEAALAALSLQDSDSGRPLMVLEARLRQQTLTLSLRATADEHVYLGRPPAPTRATPFRPCSALLGATGARAPALLPLLSGRSAPRPCLVICCS